jgi:putative transposase
MDLIEELKTHSSKWIKTKGVEYEKFYWQRGYGGFSVQHTQTDIVKHYIETQDQHHKHISFKEEYLIFLKENDIDYDERYVWD